MSIGATLPMDFLTGNMEAKNMDLWAGMYGTPTACLEAIKELGVTSIELRGVTKHTRPAQLREAMEVILDSGLMPTIHAWLPRDFAVLRALLDEADAALYRHGVKRVVPVTVHGYSYGESTPEEEAAEDTVLGLKTLRSELWGRDTLFIAAFEICRDKGFGGVGNSFASVYQIAREAGFKDLGICWDVGHSLSNHLYQGHVLMPPAEFIKEVVHTHIHGVGTNKRTHAYFSPGDSYIADCVGVLMDVGYQGIYNLELYPDRWGESPAVSRAKFEETIRALGEMVSGCR